MYVYMSIYDIPIMSRIMTRFFRWNCFPALLWAGKAGSVAILNTLLGGSSREGQLQDTLSAGAGSTVSGLCRHREGAGMKKGWEDPLRHCALGTEG